MFFLTITISSPKSSYSIYGGKSITDELMPVDIKNIALHRIVVMLMSLTVQSSQHGIAAPSADRYTTKA